MEMEKPRKELTARIGGSLLGVSVVGLLIPISYMRGNSFSGSEILLAGAIGLTVICVLAGLAFRYLDD